MRHLLLLVVCFACSPGGWPNNGSNNKDTKPSNSEDFLFLEGSPDEPALEHIPQRSFEPLGADDFGQNPYLGIETSRRHLYVGLREDATVGEVNDALSDLHGTMGGTIPPVGILQLILPDDATFEELEAAVETLAKHSAVDAVTEDFPLAPSILPRPPQSTVLNLCCRTTDASGNHNWGLELVHAPNAWNLNKAIERLSTPLPVVAVMDRYFVRHEDLDGILSIVGPEGEGDKIVGCEVRAHGIAVAGVIGAHFDNGRYLDGVAPRVRIVGISRSAAALLVTAGQQVYDLAEFLPMVTPRPRVVNISMGFSFNNIDGPCDPRPNASRNPCGSITRGRIEEMGRLAARVVRSLNPDDRSQILFVQSAGNRGDTFENFPADLDSPLGWAADHESDLGDHVIVVEALKRRGTSGWEADRASFSTINGDIFAPGSQVGVLWQSAYLSKDRMVLYRDNACVTEGTSFAAPLVAGAAAFLLSIDSTLNNRQLKQLLTEAPYAAPVTAEEAGPSSTRTRLDLFRAALGIDVLRENDRVRKMLADFDDGSVDGCRRVTTNDACEAAGAYTVDTGGDGNVNMRDFRRFRDALLLVTGNGSYLDGAATNLKRGDLNQNTAVDMPSQEIFARANLNADEAISLDRTTPLPGFASPATDLDVFKSVYEGDPVQNWPKERLQHLLKSADLVIRAQKMIDAHNVGLAASDPQRVVAIDVTIKGELHPSDGLPADLGCPDADSDGEPDTPSDTDCQALAHIQVGPDEVVLTTPLRWGPRLEWRFVRCTGSPPTCTRDTARFALPLDSLNPGEDRVVDIIPSLGINHAAGPVVASRECEYSPGRCECDACAGSVVVFPSGQSLPSVCTGSASTPSSSCPFTLRWFCNAGDAATDDCSYASGGSAEATLTYHTSLYSLVVGPGTCNDPTGVVQATIFATTEAGCPVTMGTAPISFACMSNE